MSISFKKSSEAITRSVYGDYAVCLNLGDGVDRHIDEEGARLLLAQLKRALGVEDAQNELIEALRAVADWLKTSDQAIDVRGASKIDRIVHAALEKAEGEVG